MRSRVMFAFSPPASVLREAEKLFELVPPVPLDLSTEQVVVGAHDLQPHGLLISAHQRLPAAAIELLPSSIRVIATCSVGFDHVHLPTARQRQIVVTNTPDVLTDCTADFAIFLMLAACRRARDYDHVIREGWGRSMGLGELLGLQVTGRTLGILGMGRIGQATARRAGGFGMRILYTNRNRLPAHLEAGATFCADLNELLPQCQVLSLHAPATPETTHIINAETLAKLPRGAVLVNTARGALVDETALVAALKSGQLFAAGLDVLQNEPHVNTELAALPNVYLTPHMGSATVETRHAMGMRAVENAHAVLTQRPARDPL